MRSILENLDSNDYIGENNITGKHFIGIFVKFHNHSQFLFVNIENAVTLQLQYI